MQQASRNHRLSHSVTELSLSRLKGFLALVGIIFCVISCGPIPASDPKLVSAKDFVRQQKLAPDLNSMQNFVNRRCLECHLEANARNQRVVLFDLSTIIEGSLVRLPGARQNLIKPGCPKQSFFLMVLRANKMPPRPAPIIDEESLKTIEDWILSLDSGTGTNCNSDEPAD